MSHLFTDQSPVSPSRAPSCTHSDILASMEIIAAFPSEMSFQLQALQALICMREYKVTSPCCSPPPIIYLLLSMCVYKFDVLLSLLVCLLTGRVGIGLNSLPLQRDSKRRAIMGSYRIVNALEMVSLSNHNHSARISNRLGMNWNSFLQTWVRM